MKFALQQFYMVESWALVALGVLHTGSTFRLYNAFTLQAHWFMSAGILMILVGAVNLLNRKYGGGAPALCRIAIGADFEKREARGVARGIIAIGDIAIGGIALGGVALGGIAFGGLAAGVLGLGGLSIALLAVGGVAIGGLALGGCAIGYQALGGLAIGYYSTGGLSIGPHPQGGSLIYWPSL